MDQAVKKQIEAAFAHEIEPVEVSFLYKVGMVLVTGVMLLLPVIYLLIVAAVGYGVYYHSVEHLSWFEELPARVALVGYLAPLIAGGILFIYMAKPLIPRFSRRQEPLYEVDETTEPELCRLIHQICDAVDAPYPKRIELMMDANASAGFRRGIFSFLFGGDLVLSIGLPLLSSLTVQQLSGVIAHEMGHFSQGAGMRLSYVINRVNYWFVEAVYGGGEFDEKIANAAEETGGSAALLLILTQLFIWLTRLVLFLFMMLGYLLSNFLSRQMEYDADLYEIRMSGTTSFESTSYSMALLGIAQENVFTMATLTRRFRVLPDDIPQLVKVRGKKILKENRDEVINSVLVPDTRLFDTHPSMKDRIANAKRQQEKGICKVKAAASVLFRDFGGLSKQLTKKFYAETLGPKFGELNLLSNEEYLKHFKDNIDKYHPQTRRVAV